MSAAIARAFVDARRTGLTLVSYPGEIPAALDAAYAIQDNAIDLNGRQIGGWKVGRIGADLVERFGTERIAGPIFSNTIVEAAAEDEPSVPVLAGFAAVEAEVMLQVGETPPPGESLDAIRDYVSEIRFGLEIASSPFPGINEFGPTVTVSDFGNNFGLVLGPRIPGWRTRDLLSAPVSLAIDGQVIGTGSLADMLDGPFGAVRFLAAALAKRGRRLEPGQWVSSGAITGVHPIVPGQLAQAQFDGSYSVACRAVRFVGQGNAL